MIRTLATIFGVFCAATLLSECIAVGILWSRGQLSSQSLREIRMALSGENEARFADAPDEQQSRPSFEDVTAHRALAVLELNTRQSELQLLKAMLDARKRALKSDTDAFLAMKNAFEKRLNDLKSELTSAATEQTRTILATLPPAEAVNNLLQLPLEENVRLLQGMPEKQIARILQEFSKRSADEAQRGLQIFEAISRGEPAGTLVEEGRKQLSAGAVPAT